MEAAIALTGQVAGRIDSVRPVREILDDIMAEYQAAVAALPA
jgi:enoyl-[acyl-carrier protein] reductase II